ncbi:MAG: alpha-amylase family glycosyl hydrolase [Lachnospiraceae bacterium]|nr:alpha-amylase family glycosyl hydrolase [Lachnospiraceae bacterium]
MKEMQGFPQPLGVTITKECVNFSVQVPFGKTCDLLLYKNGEKEPAFVCSMPETQSIGEVRFLALSGFEPKEYGYHYAIDGRQCLDPYVKELTKRQTFGGAFSLESGDVVGKVAVLPYDWEGDKPLQIPKQEVIAYSLHVRGFTKHSSSKVKQKGTFYGIVEKLAYLKELGINQIQCMPVYEFLERNGDKVNYWGYGQGFYFAPKATYSADISPVKELKDMVKACHKMGIEVVLEMPFTADVLPQTALECLKYYLLEFHIDGFILNPYVTPLAGIQNEPLLKGCKILYKDDEMQNVLRRFLKGDEAMIDEMMRVLVFCNQRDGKFHYISNQTGFTLKDLVSYDGKHNERNGEQNQDGPVYNYSWNCGAEGPSRKRGVLKLRKQQLRNAFFLLLTSQGMPCILAGDEFENSQKGNNNVYCQDNETAWLDWNQLKKDDSLFFFVKDLIALRKSLTCLRQSGELKGLDDTGSGFPDVSFHGENAWQSPNETASRQLGILYYDDEAPCFIAYNMHWIRHTFALPTLPKKKKYYVVADTMQGVFAKPVKLEAQKKLELLPRCIMILIGK